MLLNPLYLKSQFHKKYLQKVRIIFFSQPNYADINAYAEETSLDDFWLFD